MKEREEGGVKRLDSSEVIQIVEFGQNPSQLFEKPHPAPDPRLVESAKGLFDILYEPQSYVAIRCKPKFGDDSVGIRVISKDRSSFNMLTANNELIKKSLITSKGESNVVKELGSIYSYFKIYNEDKGIFTVDPISVFDSIDDYFVACRSNENSFVIYSLSSLDLRFAISFHKVVLRISVDDSKCCAHRREDEVLVHGRRRRSSGRVETL